MAVFGFKDQGGAVNMLLTGPVTFEPKLNDKGSMVKFSVKYADKKYMNVTAWADGPIGRLAMCLEKGDVVLCAGTWEQWQHEGKTYENLKLGAYGFLQALQAPPEDEAAGGGDDGGAAGGGARYSALEDAGEELPF